MPTKKKSKSDKDKKYNHINPLRQVPVYSLRVEYEPSKYPIRLTPVLEDCIVNSGTDLLAGLRDIQYVFRNEADLEYASRHIYDIGGDDIAQELGAELIPRILAKMLRIKKKKA